MTINYIVFFLFAVFYGSFSVRIVERPQTVYDRAPKIRISGEGLTGAANQIHLTFEPALRENKDYTLLKQTDDILVLKLIANHKWADTAAAVEDGYMVSLSLTSVVIDNEGSGDNLLEDGPIIVAQVIPTPIVKQSSEIFYQSMSTKLFINGTGFVSDAQREISLYFEPSLFYEIDYELGPVRFDSITILLRPDAYWRQEPGPLYLIGIDTGGGAMTLGSDGEGVLIAEIQANLPEHESITVATNMDPIYQDTAELVVRGTGFSRRGTTLRFANGIMGSGVNYTTISTSDSDVKLRLTSGSQWRRNGASLPGTLLLLAVNAGDGYIPVGPTNAKKGRVVATVFETPSIIAQHPQLFMTHSHELNIRGTGFVRPPAGNTRLLFNPPLIEGTDYSLSVDDSENLVLTLLHDKSWRSKPGSLTITAINTLGTTDGIMYLGDSGIVVADVIDDTDSIDTGGVSIRQSFTPIYQSFIHESFDVIGSGFSSDIKVVMDPPSIMQEDVFKITYKDSKLIRFDLLDGKTWGQPGNLIIKQVIVGGKSYEIAQGNGIRVAVVNEDPKITRSDAAVFESHSKVIMIKGSGFSTIDSMSVKLSPTLNGAYQISSVNEDNFLVRLREGYDWLADSYNLKEEDRIPLLVTSINTGAGEVKFDTPVQVGTIQMDREEHYCDDSCEFAFDTVCDDGSAPVFGEYGYYGIDDDYGGIYYADDDDVMRSGLDDDFGGYYDDYQLDDIYLVSACYRGTDCTDCGGILGDPLSASDVCTNTCKYPRDGTCDDPRGQDICEMGSDCQDCGPAGHSNFTAWDDNMWWDDIDDFTINDNTLLDQTKGLKANRHKIAYNNELTVPEGPGAVFITVLEGMVYTVAALIGGLAGFVLMRWYNGHRIPFLQVFEPDSPESNTTTIELAGGQRLRGQQGITPDVVRT